MKYWVMLSCFVSLVSCGTAANSPVIQAIQANVLKLSATQEPARDFETQKQDVLKSVATSGSKAPVLLVELPVLNAVASLVIAGKNGSATTWIDPSGVSLTLQDDVVISTRGLGHDLMSADISGVIPALAGSSKPYSRVHRYLNGEGQLVPMKFQCSVVKTIAGLIETCSTGLIQFKNIFPHGENKNAASHQWLGEDIGMARITRLQ